MKEYHRSDNGSIQASGLYRFRIGEFAVAVIGEPVETSASGRMSVLFVDTGRQKILIDAGAGPVPEVGSWWLIENLARAGINPVEIDVILISHTHYENVGGLSDSCGNAVFPNARYFIGRREWEVWNSKTIGLAAKQSAQIRARRIEAARAVVASRISLIRAGEEIVPGMYALDARGHTCGQLAFIISSKGETLVHTGDILSGGPGQFRSPGRDVATDRDCLLGAVTRLTMLAQLASDRCLTFAPRARFPGLGFIICRRDVFGWRSWSKARCLSETSTL